VRSYQSAEQVAQEQFQIIPIRAGKKTFRRWFTEVENVVGTCVLRVSRTHLRQNNEHAGGTIHSCVMKRSSSGDPFKMDSTKRPKPPHWNASPGEMPEMVRAAYKEVFSSERRGLLQSTYRKRCIQSLGITASYPDAISSLDIASLVPPVLRIDPRIATEITRKLAEAARQKQRIIRAKFIYRKKRAKLIRIFETFATKDDLMREVWNIIEEAKQEENWKGSMPAATWFLQRAGKFAQHNEDDLIDSEDDCEIIGETCQADSESSVFEVDTCAVNEDDLIDSEDDCEIIGETCQADSESSVFEDYTSGRIGGVNATATANAIPMSSPSYSPFGGSEDSSEVGRHFKMFLFDSEDLSTVPGGSTSRISHEKITPASATALVSPYEGIDPPSLQTDPSVYTPEKVPDAGMVNELESNFSRMAPGDVQQFMRRLQQRVNRQLAERAAQLIRILGESERAEVMDELHKMST
ncbi:hypothetical protein Tcan_06912, partial [Toxocara canis]